MFTSSNGAFGSLHVNEIALKAEVTSATIRYYSRTGLIHPHQNPGNGYRCFSMSDLRRVLFIRQAQALGLTLCEIRTILDTSDHGELTNCRVKYLVQKSLESVKLHINELQETQKRIEQALSTWAMAGSEAPINSEFSSLIELQHTGKGN